LKNKGIDEDFGNFFKGQSALIIQKGDAIASLKVLVEFEKTHANMKIRGGPFRRQSFETGGNESGRVSPAPVPFCWPAFGAPAGAADSVGGCVDGGSSELWPACKIENRCRKRKEAEIFGTLCSLGATAPSEEIWRSAQLMM
jgi:hypothetical protein